MENDSSFSRVLGVNLAYTCFCKLGMLFSLRRHVDSTQLNMCINTRVVKISLVLTGSTVKTTEIFNHETGQKHDTISSLAQTPSEECLQGMNVTNICTGRYSQDSFFPPSSSFRYFFSFSPCMCLNSSLFGCSCCDKGSQHCYVVRGFKVGWRIPV